MILVRVIRAFIGAAVLLALVFIATQGTIATTQQRLSSPDPFVANNGVVPDNAIYKGPFFKLNHSWPTKRLPPIVAPPWLKAIGGGKITKANAAAYVAALKAYVTPNARSLFLKYAQWDASVAKWYNEPWLGVKRESIHGMYPAGTFGPAIFPGTGLSKTFDTHVLTYYDERAAYTLHKVWGDSAKQPDAKTANFQFDEGSVIVKAAVFVSDDPKTQVGWWPATNGAVKWPLFVGLPEQVPDDQPPSKPMIATGFLMQFDIIVKDSIAAPKTGWVFSTLVYDASAVGDAWEKMVPLGAMWGNDPDIDSSAHPGEALNETWINPVAPKYSTQTLGWGGRLSGPNDGARNDIQVGANVKINEADSSCMSCHSPAEWQPAQHKRLSFILPSYPNPNPGTPYKPCPNPKDPKNPYICSPAPGSNVWMAWFQDRSGTEPKDIGTGSVATDYDMVFAYKTLPMWWAATGPARSSVPFTDRFSHIAVPSKNINEYTGAPLR